MNTVTVGNIYKHYKGMMYYVLGIAKHSETLEDMVVYIPLYVNDRAPLWVRPLSMFTENVIVDGVQQPRFSEVTTI